MASAPSSPERTRAGPEALPRRSSDHAVETGRPSSRLGIDEDAKSEGSASPSEQSHSKKRFLQARDKSQNRKSMAAMMSGTGKGKAVNIHDHLNKSDEALPNSSGSLPDYVKPAAVEENGERLAKDVFDRDKNIIESSESDDTSSDDDSTHEGTRGRKKRADITSITPSDFEKSKNEKPKLTEEKSSEKTTGPQEKKPRKSALKAVVHPQTSFDIPTPRIQSVAGTPYGSDDEAEIGDIHRAQKLSITMSAIDNGVHNRSIRTIVRGNFSGLSDTGDLGRRRRRKYLVATDLSEESVYALEWTIGTVLRDGDTIFAIYVMHEDSTSTSAVQVGEGAKVMKDTTAIVGTQTKEAQNSGYGSRTILGRLGPGTTSKAHSADSRASSMAEAERVRAVETVSQTCVKLLRKTVLQVRIAVEVIHCKNPKSMITEAIDELEPTLVIVGARGQSALKGVLLGSFSNYLLSNSSVPVMVARRKLKRHSSKGRLSSANVRLSNNLITPKSLSQAKVD
ncbi:hypothetical protein PENANT_c029G02318 [Penicillium antarcticum]|uniref:UspA domain-containing protein n=1 Tax=Penicillium antarcticum TaxID=416450 RepID=A0A1V6PWU8_9EURO|nr:hypothetical protein PENANT_c029G02318 [Penicillium antarcticum]